MQEDAFNHTQAFQQAIATTITCRTLIRYNSNLGTAQKEEILQEIEATLAFLNKRMEVNASIESSSALSPEKLADLLIGDETVYEEDELPGALPARQKEEYELSIHHLHRLYRIYLSNEPGKGIAALETRYRAVMGVLDQLQEVVETRHDNTMRDLLANNLLANDLTASDLLIRIRGFVTALYCMFREFAALFSKAIEGQSLDIDTEAMVLPQESPREVAQQVVRDITPLMYVYNKQHQFQQRQGSLRESAHDATAFLIFLQECLGETFAKRQEVVAQIKNTASLLNELVTLLTDYELAVTSIMQSPSKSR
ncbi:MAG TPA: hypothetical protein VF458_14035 [Ktedonobacteraceae bacterium]